MDAVDQPSGTVLRKSLRDGSLVLLALAHRDVFQGSEIGGFVSRPAAWAMHSA
jgi:hypothetical protein